ncbi:LOW QUALITY PROTEIN: dual specificity mitogen-activated protein kinase kinase hemipterous-like [Palaemon carinicauda]|uniref:LOW QUALITY PROTEIN: dual specificity mitogen-activated protein kinase kinase hemipterous-like n=1 Tax=Palaemon carinicauda TaxID=392227 RepID=UPI0035B5ED88
MATLSSLQDRLQGLGTRLQAENESKSRERMNTNLSLDFSRERAGSERRPKPLPIGDGRLQGRPNTISGRQRERPKIEPFFFEQKQQSELPDLDAHVKEITRKNGTLVIENKRYKSSKEDMEYLSELGNGTSGNVVKMLHKSSKKEIAVKQMRRSGNMEETKRVFFDLEVVLKSHDCPYIVQCLGCFITDSDVWICMELMATCLDKLTKRYKQPIPERILGKISVATLKALHYLKENHGVIHRDVKPSNILLDKHGNIKLCDFGISGRLVDSKAKTRSAGCAAYMAPERIDPPDPTKPDYDIRADVWSLGITLVELATGQFPYKDCRNDFEVLTKVLQDDPPSLPETGNFSREFCEFVKDCLIKEYRNRPKYKKLLDYPFIKKYEKEKVDVSAWFAEVCQVIESKVRNSPQRVSIFSSPLLPRASRSNSKPPSAPNSSGGGGGGSECIPPPPPVAPRRRSRTPEAHSHERVNSQPSQQQQQPQPPPQINQEQPQEERPQESIQQELQAKKKLQHQHKNGNGFSPSRSCSGSTSSSGSSSSSNGESGVVSQPPLPASPSLTRAVSASPSRSGPPLSPAPSRAYSASPLQRSIPPSSVPPLSYPGVSHMGPLPYPPNSMPHHQYAVPFSSQQAFSPFNYSPKPYSQAYSQYSNPYTQVLPPRSSHSSFYNNMSSSRDSQSRDVHSSSSSSHHSSSSSGNSSTTHMSGDMAGTSGSVREMASSWPTPGHLPGLSAGQREAWGGGVGSSQGGPPAATTSLTHTSPMHRKTPEPVRFNPEPWAPRGRFAQPAHSHHSRSHSTDLSSRGLPSSRFPPTYLPPHVSPLVSRRIVESRAAAAASLSATNNSHLGAPPGVLPTSSSSLPPPSVSLTTPHYRYSQEAYYNSRPYYTPEPQRRILPRLGNP